MPRFPSIAAPATVAVALALALSLSACGQNEEDAVTATTNDFVSAFTDGDWGEVCSLLTTDAKAQLSKAGALLGGGDTCEKAMKLAGGSMGDAARRKLRANTIKDVSVDGDSAIVTYVEGTAPTELRKSGGKWRIHMRVSE